MDTKKIINALTEHLDHDTGYKMVGFENGALGHNTTFDISNLPPNEFFAPYFKVDNIEQAKKIIKEVLEIQNNLEPIPSFEEKYETILASKSIDPTADLYISVFKPDRHI